jgi:hypothetical protein
MLIRISKSENICSPILASLITTISGANQCYASHQSCTHPLAIGWNPCHTTYVPMRERHMRKIEQQMIEAIKDSRNWKSGNTSVCYSADYDTSRVYLHNNLIAIVSDTDVEVFDGGWQSNTTKSRLNAICNAFCIDGEGIFQKDFQWFVHKFVGQAGASKVYNKEEFVNGYVFG